MSARTRLLFAAITAAPATAQWELIATPTSPPARYYGGMTYDVIRGQTVVFGGGQSAPGFRNDMWTFDGTDWTQVTPPTVPTARGGFQMIYDLARDRVVVFGGRAGTGFNPPLSNETWEYDGTTWTQVITANAPAPRQWFAMAYDPARSRTVLYGGQASNFPIDSNETWEYDGTNWVLRNPATNPGPLENAAMCYHGALGRIVLYSGINVQVGGTTQTWTFDGTNWAQIATTGPVPSARTLARMAYDDSRGACILAGGMNPSTGTLLNDIWQFNGAQWREMFATGPVGRRGFGLVYDQARQRTVLHCGLDQAFVGVTDTWMFGPTSSQFGFGCAGSNGVPVLVAATPARIGATFVAGMGNLLTVAPLAVIATGFSTTNWGPAPLPLDMGSFGMPTCFLFVSPDQIATVPAFGGVATYALTIPADPWFVGQLFHQQAFSFELPGFNAFGGVLSNATTMSIGW